MTGGAVLVALAAASAVSWHDLPDVGKAAADAAGAPVKSVAVSGDPGLGCVKIDVELALPANASPEEVSAGLAEGLGPNATFRANPDHTGGQIVLGPYRGAVSIGFSESGDRAKVFACLCNDRYPAAAVVACPAPSSR